ncbi:Helicase associated domain protein [Streptomyces sp. NPDC093089]|uniref:Helicase associated domain protein n=1 Tax=Streptomyces sp. NPDC093089 TaxID=3366024 RepID=UPI00380E4FFC
MLHDTPVERLTSELWTRERAAADCVLNAFAMGYERQQVIMPCGTGKTHLAVHIAHELISSSRSLTVLPTLALLNQTARVWYTSGRPGHYFGLCSDPQTSEPVLSDALTMIRDPAQLATALRRVEGPVSVFVTYHSLPKLVEAHRKHLLPQWDIAVVDEAHRTAGRRHKPWAVIHDNGAIPARHRLYLTATPRIWDVNRGITVEPIASMDDVSLYGNVAYRYSLAEAIQEGRLADYRIAAPEIHDSQLRAYLTERDGARRSPQADAMRVAVAQLALFKAREEHKIRRTVVFSRSIARSEAFAETLSETAASIPGSHADNLWAASVHGRLGRLERGERIARFTQPPQPHNPLPVELSVLCNVRLCVEGVDFPLADSVLFADPKQSTIDIVQAIGRALRIGPESNKISTLIVPVLFGPGQRPEEATFGTPYHLLHQVMIALKAYDEHYFRRLPINGTKLLLPTPAFAIRPARAAEIAPHLMLRIMKPEPDTWEAGMARAQQFFSTHGHLNVPSNHITPDGFHLGCWLGYQRALKSSGSLAPARVAALATCNMTWAYPRDSTETFLETAQAYARHHGHLLPEPAQTYQRKPLGQWLAEQRRLANEGALPAPYRRALKDIDPWWNPAWPHAWQRMCARARTPGTSLVIHNSLPPAQADEITQWLDEQFDIFPTLTQGQQAQLDALPLPDAPLALALRRPFGPQATTHAHGLRAARRFYRNHQHLRVPAHHIDIHDGIRFPLGQWIADLRTLAGAGRLSPEEIASVEALAMEWIPGLQCDDTPAAFVGASAHAGQDDPAGDTQTHECSNHSEPAGSDAAPELSIWIADNEPSPPALADVMFRGGRRMLLTMPSGAGKTMTAAVAVHEAGAGTCLVLCPTRSYLHHVVKTWRMLGKGPLAGINLRPSRSGKVGTRLISARELAHWMAKQPPGSLVVALYDDAELISRSHRKHRLPPWDQLIIEEAHRTAEGSIDPQHPHAAIHYDDCILAYTRIYLTANPYIPCELPKPAGDTTKADWIVNMPAQPIFGPYRPTVGRQDLLDEGLLSPHQFIQIEVPDLPQSRPWRTQALGTRHAIERFNLRRVVVALENVAQARDFACQLAVRMLGAEILVPPQGPVRYTHDQPVIRCQGLDDPMPPDLDAVVLPADSYTTMELVNVLSPLMGQHADRAAQTAIIVPVPVPTDGSSSVATPLLVRRVSAALWAHHFLRRRTLPLSRQRTMQPT